MSVARLKYTVSPTLVRTSPPANSTFYMPSSDVEGIDFFDVRALDKMLVEVDADQPITVEVENSPTGNVADARPLAGYMIPSTSFDTARRNTIAMDGADACVGFIRFRVTTGATAPSSIKIWIEAKL